MGKPAGPRGWLTRLLACTDTGVLRCRTGLVPCINSPQTQLLGIGRSEGGGYFSLQGLFKRRGYQVEHQAVLCRMEALFPDFSSLFLITRQTSSRGALVGLPSARSNRNKKKTWGISQPIFTYPSVPNDVCFYFWITKYLGLGWLFGQPICPER